MCKAMLSFVEKVSFIVPADGAINQIRNFLFGIAVIRENVYLRNQVLSLIHI